MFVPYSEIAESSRVWIYQSDRILTDQEVVFVKQRLLEFCNNWKAHQAHLKSSYQVLHNRFIILLVDEQQLDASGCSIDASVALLKSLEKDYNLDLFNRTIVAYEEEQNIFTMPLLSFKKLVKADTIVFNNLVTDKSGLENDWRVVAKDSWHAKWLV